MLTRLKRVPWRADPHDGRWQQAARRNIWHVAGRDPKLVIDTGMGVTSLVDEMQDLLAKTGAAVATQRHGDHIGGHHELDDTVAHVSRTADVVHGGHDPSFGCAHLHEITCDYLKLRA